MNGAVPTQLRDELRTATRRYLAAAEPTAVGPRGRVERSAGEWLALATELGLPGITVAEPDGGLGLGPDVAVLAHEELGRVLDEGPYLATVGLVLPALQAARDRSGPASERVTERITELITGIAAGRLAFGARAELEPDWPELTSNADGTVDGVLALVRDPDASAGLIVNARLDGQPVLVVVDPRAPGVAAIPVETIDLTRPLARLELDRTRVEVLARDTAAEHAWVAAGRAGALALAADSVGVAARALEITVDYVGARRQFGRTIGSFQAVKHQCAQMLVQLEAARSALSLVVDPDADGAVVGLAAARLLCGRAAWEITEAAVHLHGGIGFTWEHRMHLYFRRAKTNQILLAPDRAQHDILLEAVAAQSGRPS